MPAIAILGETLIHLIADAHSPVQTKNGLHRFSDILR
jgi:hypothetical protein